LARSIGAALLLLLTLGGFAAAQDPLVTIKTLYASAAYEDALSAIDRLRSAGPAANDSRGLDQYRAFCLLALGREAEATKAIEDVVTADPFFAPDQNEVSPRVLTLFHAVRHRLLPALVQQKYAMAKATYDRKEFEAAAEQFTRVTSLIDDPDMDQKTPGLGDLRTLAGGFLDLAKNAATPPKPPPPPAPATPAPPPAPVRSVFDASDPQVAPPVTVRQDVPPFPTDSTVQTKIPMRPGAVELVIDEMGRVERAIIRQSISPFYDPMLLAATANWRYKPAQHDGKPVKYRKLIQISVEPPK
jgi:tetratricopeptide (TPR) repeat protein